MNIKTRLNAFTLRLYVLFATLFASVMPAAADDLFAGGKETVTNTIGEGSSGEFYMLAAGLIGGIIVGIVQKNWIGGIVGFFVGVVFWEIGKGIVGL
ncbi:hypothetical protein KIT90_20505 [Vibrio sp. B172a]|uniref:type IV conjugative transfer system pilin TraA n=1 Tax=Vibrio sp. B172a TaxID=2835790 RepID=UPI0025520E5E|nr:type IV conjugative transfer system pilin TraA [Vibrio sp. B172a]MDK9783764.1 hypothetical protein [Vibrio sp. B172a]